MSKLKPFGDNPHRQWVSGGLDDVMGHIEALIHDEEERPMASGGPREKRLHLVYDALELLNKAAEY